MRLKGWRLGTAMGCSRTRTAEALWKRSEQEKREWLQCSPDVLGPGSRATPARGETRRGVGQRVVACAGGPDSRKTYTGPVRSATARYRPSGEKSVPLMYSGGVHCQAPPPFCTS